MKLVKLSVESVVVNVVHVVFCKSSLHCSQEPEDGERKGKDEEEGRNPKIKAQRADGCPE